jgi:hypothetical protein
VVARERLGQPGQRLRSEVGSGSADPICREAAKTGRSRSAVCAISSGSTRTSPTTVMKFVSPVQRGTRCVWM